jgi:hypothetical protein
VAGGKTPGGRFCNLFKFRDGRISSVHIYLDPDYTERMKHALDRVRIVSGDILKLSVRTFVSHSLEAQRWQGHSRVNVC